MTLGGSSCTLTYAELGREHARPHHLQGVFAAHPHRLPKEYCRCLSYRMSRKDMIRDIYRDDG
jgi:hypothetical protein